MIGYLLFHYLTKLKDSAEGVLFIRELADEMRERSDSEAEVQVTMDLA